MLFVFLVLQTMSTGHDLRDDGVSLEGSEEDSTLSNLSSVTDDKSTSEQVNHQVDHDHSSISEKASALKEHDVPDEETAQAERVKVELDKELEENDGWLKILGNDEIMKKVCRIIFCTWKKFTLVLVMTSNDIALYGFLFAWHGREISLVIIIFYKVVPKAMLI